MIVNEICDSEKINYLNGSLKNFWFSMMIESKKS